MVIWGYMWLYVVIMWLYVVICGYMGLSMVICGYQGCMWLLIY